MLTPARSAIALAVQPSKPCRYKMRAAASSTAFTSRWRATEWAVYVVPDACGLINKLLFVFRHQAPA